jgi:hypothetical protein
MEIIITTATTMPLSAVTTTPLRITINTIRTPGNTGPIDEATAVYNGQTFQARSRSGASMKLARMLVEAGCADGPWEVFGPDGLRRLHGPSLHRLNRLTVQETDAHGPRIVRYVPRVIPGP